MKLLLMSATISRRYGVLRAKLVTAYPKSDDRDCVRKSGSAQADGFVLE